MKRIRNKAFTIVELIVVMAVIGVMVLLAMPKFMGYTEKARLTEIKSNIKQLENASERYYMDNQSWPRLSDTPYSAEQLETFAQEIKDKTGAIITLEEDGKYYPVDYDKLQKYVKKPKDNVQYIIQNPIGEIYYLNDLTEEGKQHLITIKNNPPVQDEEPNNKPMAIISMNPEQDLKTSTNITFSYINSTDPDGDAIINAEWEGKQDRYSAGNHIVRLRVQDAKHMWSDWVEVSFDVEETNEIFNYTGNYQTFTAPTTGIYKLEVWGAQGGSDGSILGGKGGYSTGTISLQEGQSLYIYVGGAGSSPTNNIGGVGGYNGGGKGGNSSGTPYLGASSGGGATDIRTVSGTWNNLLSLQSRIIVAGGGGGGMWFAGGYGGGLVGGNSEKGYASVGIGATQTTGYALGQGQPGIDKPYPSNCGAEGNAGGGGGYYGGFSPQVVGDYSISGGGGGSGYIGGVQNGNIVSGNLDVPTHDGSSTMIGNTGNGYAKITYIGQ